MPSVDLPIHFIPRRVVSLVPSMTESLYDLGLGGGLVGATDYCIHPEERLRGVPRVGGTKDFRIEEIVRLAPDLVIANQEENDELLVRQLIESPIQVWLTFPRTVNDALKDLAELAGIFRNETAARIVQVLEKNVEYCRMASEDNRRRYFCPIWQGEVGGQPWWMAFNGDTYSSDLLSILGGENIFAGRNRKYPLTADVAGAAEEPAGSRDTRYPRVNLDEIIAGKPESILFPDEPYRFSDLEKQGLVDRLSAVLGYAPDCLSVDGSLITWPGTRISKALEELGGVFL